VLVEEDLRETFLAFQHQQVAVAVVVASAGKTILQLHQEVAIQSSLGLAGLLLALVIMA
jgi:hypothetical protein